MKYPEILHICVNYGNYDESNQFVKDCLAQGSADCVKIALCDNSAEGVSVDNRLSQWQGHPQVEVISLPKNPGYLGAAHCAYEYFLKQTSPQEETLGDAWPRELKFLLLSNTDIRYCDNDFYRKLLDINPNENCALIAPSIRSTLTGCESNPLYSLRPSRQKMKFLSFVYRVYPLAWLYHTLSFLKNTLFKNTLFGATKRAEVKDKAPNKVLGKVLGKAPEKTSSKTPGTGGGEALSFYASHGCFIIFTPTFFSHGGSLNYPVKLYGEELFIAEQLQRKNLAIQWAPSIQILHREKGTENKLADRIGLSRKSFKFKKESSRYLAKIWSA